MIERNFEAFRDPDLAKGLITQIRSRSRRPIRLMEVCGTHTVALFRSGVRSLLPDTIGLLSGPGCPVCVTAQGEIDAFVALAQRPDTIVATFGDLLRVPGSGTTLQAAKGEGADVRIVYSAVDALAFARDNPEKEVVFLGVGFETTAPTIAAAIFSARQSGCMNFSIAAAHKTVPAALGALLGRSDLKVDGLLLPGHVSVMIGVAGYRPFFNASQMPSAITGFEPTDLLMGIAELVTQIETGRPRLYNAYPRAVTEGGNPKAMALLEQVFAPADVPWRGLGRIPASGLVLRPEFERFDAFRRFDIQIVDAPEPKGCACGQILTGTRIPPECPLYKTTCSPIHPVGPCMVSSEGTCAAYYRYHQASS
ncbi:MAG: hydrogenase formation protein HypD [Desulfosarcinaceae bacterium]|nr:hydrogenase formation protein HypD [Desulfosarcinaceae bacterium]